ncbi:hypothetical protein MASR2M52_17850 [Pedobacter sp.]
MLLLPFLGEAQQVQWAHKVLKYSSDLGGKVNGVKQILGRPSSFPQGGATATAWAVKDASKDAFIEVEYEKEQEVRQIAVFENLNAGCITKVMVADATGNYKSIHRRTEGFKFKIERPRISVVLFKIKFNFDKKKRKVSQAPDVSHNADVAYFFLESPEKVKKVKVHFDFSIKPGQKQIDAIGISDSEEPIYPDLNLIPNAENLVAEPIIYAKSENELLGYPFKIENKLHYYGYDAETKNKVPYVFELETRQSNKFDKLTDAPSDYATIQGHVKSENKILMGYLDHYTRAQKTGYRFFDYKQGSYKPGELLNVLAFSNYSEYTDCYITNDGTRVIFGIESDITLGGNDLYTSTKKDDGSFGLLQNMGKQINSAGDELSPFLLSDGKTLLFASDGFSGYGDFDIYVSTRLDDTWKNWSVPKNLGSKVNSTSYDLNPFYDEGSETLYYSTYRDGKSSINKVKIPVKDLTGIN